MFRETQETEQNGLRTMAETQEKPPSTSILSHKQRQKQKHLSYSRRGASVLLLVFFVLFLASHGADPHTDFWLALLHAVAEAALVGGLADWFAVTALFRHPLGIPIPHTKLIPKKKDKLGEGLAHFIEHHFLEPEPLHHRLRTLNPARRLGHWLENPQNASWLAERLVRAVPALLDAISDKDVRHFIRGQANEKLHHFNLSLLLGRILSGLIERQQHGPLISYFADMVRRVIAYHHDRLADYIREKSGWLMPVVVDRLLASALLSSAEDLLTSITTANHPLRLGLERQMQDFAHRLKEDPGLSRDINSLKEKVLAMPDTQDYLSGLWDDIRQAIILDVQSPQPTVGILSVEGLRALGRRLQEDPALQARLNQSLEAMLVQNIAPWRQQIGHFIADRVKAWTPDDVAQRIELEVGKDLQYIRINGSLVGGFIGGLLFLGSHFLTSSHWDHFLLTLQSLLGESL